MNRLPAEKRTQILGLLVEGSSLRAASRFPSAPPRLAVSMAKLTAFGCVDAMKAYSLACDFNGVAVDYAGRAGDVGKGEARQQGKSKGGGK